MHLDTLFRLKGIPRSPFEHEEVVHQRHASSELLFAFGVGKGHSLINVNSVLLEENHKCLNRLRKF